MGARTAWALVALLALLALHPAAVRSDEPPLADQIEETLGEVESATDKLGRDLDALEAHLGGEAGAEGGAADAEAEAAFEQLRELADSDEGKALFEQLKALNEELERSGVKAFGDLEEGSYRRGGDGDWVLEALAEDIDACKTEMQMQVDEAQGGEEVEDAAPAPPAGKVGLRSSDTGDSEAESSEEEDGGAPAGPKMGLRGNDDEGAPPAEKMQLKEGGGGQAKAPKLGLRDDGAGEQSDKVCELPEEEASEEEEPAEEPAADQGGKKIEIKLRGDGEAEGAGIQEEKPSSEGEDTECKVCDELGDKILDLENEGRRLFMELQELNPLVKESVYKRNGEWRMDTLKYDIKACSPDAEDGECEAATEAEEAAQEEKGKEDRINKFAGMFGSKTLDENIKEGQEEDAKNPPPPPPPPPADDDERAC